MTYAVIAGTGSIEPGDYRAFGPFDHEADATSWGETHLLEGYRVVKMAGHAFRPPSELTAAKDRTYTRG